jgi:hypothetical protein
MKTKRDIGNEIQSLKSRKEFDSYWEIHQKLDKIYNCIVELKTNSSKASDELKKYVPVALVATMESFIRSTAAKLINSNHDYLLNAKDIFDGKFELDLYTKLHKREFTIGELIAHQIPYGKFNHITSVFDAILKEDFMQQLKAFDVNTYYIGYQGPHPKDFLPNYEQIVKDTKNVLEMRHIICHEMSTKLEIEHDELLQIFKSVKALIYQIYNYVYTILYPGSLLSNEDLFKQSKGNYDKELERLNLILDKIYKNPYNSYEAPLDVHQFKESQNLWRQYIDKYVEALYSSFGGDVYQSLVLDELSEMIKDRADDLEIEFLDEE